MARITCHDPANLTGHAGPVPFTNGVGETEDPELLAHFASQPDLFTVETDETPEPVKPEADPDATSTPTPTPRPPRR